MSSGWLDVRAAIAWALVPGLLAAAILAPRDGMFWTNLMFYWAPQGCAAGLVCLMFGAPRWPVVAGIALGLTGYLFAYAGGVAIRNPGAADAWLAYYYGVPGACAAGVAAALWPGGRLTQAPWRVICWSAILSCAGAVASLMTLRGMIE